MKRTNQAFVASLILLTYQSRAEMIDRPFFTDTARQHFAQCFPDTSKQDLDRLKNIKSYGYLDFPAATPCTTPGCNPDPRLNEFTSTRVITFDASQLNPSLARQTIYSLEGGDCSYNRIKAYSSSVSQNSIVYAYSPFHQERSCNYGFVFDKGDATADVVTTITLQQDLSTTANTVVSNVRTHNNFSFGNAFSDALVGNLLLGSIGVFVAVVAIPEVAKGIESNARFGGQKFDANFGSTGINLYEYSKVQKRLDKLGKFTPLKDYATNRSISGFIFNGTDVSVEVRQTAQVLDVVRSDFALTRAAELEFLKSLSEVSSKSHVVKPGESLWKIVKTEYLDARLFILVSQINGIKRDGAIRPGQTISLPRWHELCKYFGGNPNAVKEGESLWSKASSGQIPKQIGSIRTFSGKKNLVYPLEIVQIPTDAKR